MEKEVIQRDDNGKDTFSLFPNQPLGSQTLNRICLGEFSNRIVAVKEVPKDVWETKSKKRKGRGEDVILARLAHPNIVTYYYAKETPGATYLALEPCNYDLDQWLEIFKRENWSCNIKRDILRQVCKGIRYLHKVVGIVHRDINPKNILVKEIETGWVVKLCDFGISREIEDDRSSILENTGSGTSGWMSPEVLRPHKNYKREGDKLSRMNDVFSFGTVMYWFLTDGKHPFLETDKNQHGLKHIAIEYNVAKKYTQCINLSDMDIQHVGAIRLIMQMIAERPEDRPLISDVLKHHFFRLKNSSDTMQFLGDVNTITRRCVPDNVQLRISNNVNDLYMPWTQRFEPALIDYVRNGPITHNKNKNDQKLNIPSYNENSMWDLRRFVRNVYVHRCDLPKNIKCILGFPNDDAFLHEILSRFPLFVDDVWMACQALKHGETPEKTSVYQVFQKKYYNTTREFRTTLYDYERKPIKAFYLNLKTQELQHNQTLTSPKQERTLQEARTTNKKLGNTSLRPRCTQYPSDNRVQQTSYSQQPASQEWYNNHVGENFSQGTSSTAQPGRSSYMSSQPHNSQRPLTYPSANRVQQTSYSKQPASHEWYNNHVGENFSQGNSSTAQQGRSSYMSSQPHNSQRPLTTQYSTGGALNQVGTYVPYATDQNFSMYRFYQNLHPTQLYFVPSASRGWPMQPAGMQAPPNFPNPTLPNGNAYNTVNYYPPTI